MIAGSFILTGIGKRAKVNYDYKVCCHSSFVAFTATGGYEKLVDDFFNAVAKNRSHKVPDDTSSDLCAGVPDDAMHLIRSPVPGESDLPWTGMLFGLAINSIWYWCSDQVCIKIANFSEQTLKHI